jgi:hypothetical protein
MGMTAIIIFAGLFALAAPAARAESEPETVAVACAGAFFPAWTTSEKALLAAATVAMVIDWRQSRVIAENPGQYHERNPFLGRHPSRGTVDIYFAAALLGNALIAHALPRNWRKAWLIGMTAMEVGVIANNLAVGIGVQW